MDNAKRKFLKGTVIAMAVGGGAVVTIPFASLFKSDQTRNEYLAEHNLLVDISDIPPGGMKEVRWIIDWDVVGIMVIVRRTEQQTNDLNQLSSHLKDPNSQQSEQPHYMQNIHRSLRKNIFIAINNCTHLGCEVLYKPGHAAYLPQDWHGGFVCPCHGSLYDLAGRVYKGYPAQKNLTILPYHFIDDNLIRIGVDPPPDRKA